MMPKYMDGPTSSRSKATFMPQHENIVPLGTVQTQSGMRVVIFAGFLDASMPTWVGPS